MILKFPPALRIEWSDLTGVPVVAIASLVVTGLVLSVRPMRGLQSLELVAFDRMVQLRPQATPDQRFLVVAITEADLKKQQRWPISDQVLAEALANLQKAKPRVIGLDLYRNFPQEPGWKLLTQQFKASNLIAITNIGDTESGGTPPPMVVPSDRVGFNDVVTDADGVIRRNFMFGNTETTELYSFSLRVAQHYLASQKQLPQAAWKDYGKVRWGKAIFTPLQTNAGGYQNVDADAYQILLNYRAARDVSPQVTLTQLLDQQVDPALIKDKIVLIGTTAPSLKDEFFTPYSSAAWVNNPNMPGVLIHAQMVSQILDAVSDDRPLFWFWPEWAEILWIASWSVVGGAVAWIMRQPFTLALSGILMLGVLTGSTFGIFLHQGWVPVMTPAIAAVMTVGLVVSYRAQQAQRQQKTVMTLLGQNTSPEIAAALWSSRDRLLKSGKLPGQRLTATVLFTDIKDFSTVSEQMSPEALLNWLNEYLSVMTQEVQTHHGIINKFTGDGLMAVFGVPVPRTSAAEIAEDAKQAVACALAFGDRLRELNPGWQARGLPVVQMRAGIFTGPVVVGSLGGKNRLEYGVIGDSVNIASRLESYEKDRHVDFCRVLIAQETLEHLKQQFAVEAWGPLALKGKQQMVDVYRVIGWQTPDAEAIAPALDSPTLASVEIPQEPFVTQVDIETKTVDSH
ncbi:adenylate/guanylate cyclase domain-containing protein [Trichocoleus sp. FACHB-262]|uniref:CHASE2 domain-containing protein n=1 Tax=Trichocoleus sp. FACHB-262 TaxID=2692869 RepID=UPI0028C415AB|nr:adenylate/guanylate cyclase domain-containing protein [Trichocoleus sp. FACHB-262]